MNFLYGFMVLFFSAISSLTFADTLDFVSDLSSLVVTSQNKIPSIKINIKDEYGIVVAESLTNREGVSRVELDLGYEYVITSTLSTGEVFKQSYRHDY